MLRWILTTSLLASTACQPKKVDSTNTSSVDIDGITEIRSNGLILKLQEGQEAIDASYLVPLDYHGQRPADAKELNFMPSLKSSEILQKLSASRLCSATNAKQLSHCPLAPIYLLRKDSDLPTKIYTETTECELEYKWFCQDAGFKSAIQTILDQIPK